MDGMAASARYAEGFATHTMTGLRTASGVPSAARHGQAPTIGATTAINARSVVGPPGKACGPMTGRTASAPAAEGLAAILATGAPKRKRYSMRLDVVTWGRSSRYSRPTLTWFSARATTATPLFTWRSEERRVGKEGRSRWSPY